MENTTLKICALLDSNSVEYKLISHPETLTSEDSFKARAQAGGGYVTGAKAILMKSAPKQGGSEFNVFVLPGNRKISSKALKKQLQVKSLRFANREEMSEKTGGLVPGSMPPFASPIFTDLSNLFVDALLLETEVIGFNAASLTQSIIVPCKDYISVANPTAIFPFSL